MRIQDQESGAIETRPLREGHRAILLQPLRELAPREGLEPPTNWLTANCSTD